jgi:hypothetical protein
MGIYIFELSFWTIYYVFDLSKLDSWGLCMKRSNRLAVMRGCQWPVNYFVE